MNKKERAFQRLVLDFYDEYGRHDLPWRRTHDPYPILVSELMLQQTQVERVIPKYDAFLKRWSTVDALSRARLSSVLKEWQGLGYNRRAKFLKQAAEAVCERRDGVFPQKMDELLQLPGIGPYTAAAVSAFAYNQPVVLIETNVRRVFIHHFFADRDGVSDAELLPLIERTLPPERSREWYSALMDYGTHLKRTVGNANVRSKHYKKQSKFEGSDRQIRGAILRELAVGARTGAQLRTSQGFEPARVSEQLAKLEAEGLVRKQGSTYRLG